MQKKLNKKSNEKWIKSKTANIRKRLINSNEQVSFLMLKKVLYFLHYAALHNTLLIVFLISLFWIHILFQTVERPMYLSIKIRAYIKRCIHQSVSQSISWIINYNFIMLGLPFADGDAGETHSQSTSEWVVRLSFYCEKWFNYFHFGFRLYMY